MIIQLSNQQIIKFNLIFIMASIKFLLYLDYKRTLKTNSYY